MNSQLTKITKDLRSFITVRNTTNVLNRYYSSENGNGKSKIQVKREKITKEKQDANKSSFILDNLDVQYDKDSYNKHYTNDLGKKFMSPYSKRPLSYYPSTLEFLSNGYSINESIYAVDDIKKLGITPAPRRRGEDEEEEDEESTENFGAPAEVDLTRVSADYVDEMPRVHEQSLKLIKRLGNILHSPMKHKVFYLLSLDQQKFYQQAVRAVDSYDPELYDGKHEDMLLNEYATLIEKMTEREIILAKRQEEVDKGLWATFAPDATTLIEEMQKAKIDLREALRDVDLMEEFRQLNQEEEDALEEKLGSLYTIPQEQEDEKLTFIAAGRPGDDLLFKALYDASPVIRQQFEDFVEHVEKMIKENELAPIDLDSGDIPYNSLDIFEAIDGESKASKDMIPLVVYACERVIAGFRNTSVYRAGPDGPVTRGQLTYDQVCDWIKLFRYFRTRGLGFLKYEEEGAKEPVKSLVVSIQQEMSEFYDFLDLYKRYSNRPEMFRTFFDIMLYAKLNPKNFGQSFTKATLKKSEKEYASYSWPDTTEYDQQDITILDLFDSTFREHMHKDNQLDLVEHDIDQENANEGADLPPVPLEEQDEDIQDLIEFAKELDEFTGENKVTTHFFPDIEADIEPMDYEKRLFKDRGYSDAIAAAQSEFLSSASKYFVEERGKELTGIGLEELDDGEDNESGVNFNSVKDEFEGEEQQEQEEMNQDQEDADKDEFEDDQLSNRFDGGARNVYTDVPVLDISNIVNVARHVKVTKAGRVSSFSCTVFNGNGKGTASLGYGKGDSPAVALKRACRDAERNAYTLDRYKDVTLPSDLELHYRSTTIRFFKSRPIDQIDTRGHKQGIILPTLGLHGVNFRTYGRRKWANVLLTMQRRLEDFTNPEEAARLMGKKLVTPNSEKEKKKTLSELLQSKIAKKNTDPYNIGLVKDFLYDMEKPNKQKIRDRKLQDETNDILDKYPKDQEDSELYSHKSTKFGQHLYSDTKQVERMK